MAFFDTPLRDLKGFGPRRADVLEKCGVVTARDLLTFFPRRYLDRSTITPIARLSPEMNSVTVVGVVRARNVVVAGRKRFELLVEDSSGGKLKCVWFQGVQWVQRAFQVGDRVAFHGRPQQFGR
ncbi:MAG TPA: ATP-dependent DNA helicase RecG, partial [Rubricoccaceae bacterium]|nr:ATP-dependent DNA helicase RecG [Rubricoccaceae bacterium]